MTDHATFLRMLDEEARTIAMTAMPVLLVYADWLEEQVDLVRAEFLRLEHRLRTMTHRHRDLPAVALRLRTLGELLPPEWIAAINRPTLAGTTWKGKSGINSFVGRFLPDGALNYTQAGRTYQNGTWRQVGRVVMFEMNHHYADYEGVIVGERIRGTARNVVASSWKFELKRTESPGMVAVPNDVVHTIFEYTPPTTRAAAAPPRRAKSTRAKPATRSAKPARTPARPAKPTKPTKPTKPAKPTKPTKPTKSPAGSMKRRAATRR